MSLSEGRAVRSLTEAAEAAAAAGDWVSAARTLRDLTAKQEAELGPIHPDLANTVNNLAVASERAGDLDAAEAAFRRAYAIMLAAFDADHPDARTSARNLREFCEAHGRSYDVLNQSRERAGRSPVAPSSGSRRSLSTLLTLGAVAGLAAAGLVVWLASARGPAPLELAKATPTTSTGSKPPSAPPPEPQTAATSPPPPAAEPGSSTVTVVDALVCSDFSTTATEWRCTPITGSTSAGSFVFYTRLRSPAPTTIEHRWYRDDRLHQRVSLRVAANTGAGYRTFSRNSIGADRPGTWRVELRDADGAVLEEATFVVK